MRGYGLGRCVCFVGFLLVWPSDLVLGMPPYFFMLNSFLPSKARNSDHATKLHTSCWFCGRGRGAVPHIAAPRPRCPPAARRGVPTRQFAPDSLVRAARLDSLCNKNLRIKHVMVVKSSRISIPTHRSSDLATPRGAM